MQAGMASDPGLAVLEVRVEKIAGPGTADQRSHRKTDNQTQIVE